MKCHIMQHFTRVYTFVKLKKKGLQVKKYIFNYNLMTLDICNELSQVYCIKSKKKNPLVYKGLIKQHIVSCFKLAALISLLIVRYKLQLQEKTRKSYISLEFCSF